MSFLLLPPKIITGNIGIGLNRQTVRSALAGSPRAPHPRLRNSRSRRGNCRNCRPPRRKRRSFRYPRCRSACCFLPISRSRVSAACAAVHRLLHLGQLEHRFRKFRGHTSAWATRVSTTSASSTPVTATGFALNAASSARQLKKAKSGFFNLGTDNSGFGQNNPAGTVNTGFQNSGFDNSGFTNTSTMSTDPGDSGILNPGIGDSGYQTAAVDDAGIFVTGVISSGLFTAGTGSSGVFASGNGVSGFFTNLLEGFCGRSAPATALRGRLFSDGLYMEPKVFWPAWRESRENRRRLPGFRTDV
jgi:hypothetical protein